MPNKSVIEKCKRLGLFTLQKEDLEAKIKKLRGELEDAIEVGDIIDFEVDEVKFTLSNLNQDVAVLKDNKKLVKILGDENFISIAKVSKTEIEKQFGKAVVIKCIEKYDTDPKMILKKQK